MRFVAECCRASSSPEHEQENSQRRCPCAVRMTKLRLAILAIIIMLAVSLAVVAEAGGSGKKGVKKRIVPVAATVPGGVTACYRDDETGAAFVGVLIITVHGEDAVRTVVCALACCHRMRLPPPSPLPQERSKSGVVTAVSLESAFSFL